MRFLIALLVVSGLHAQTDVIKASWDTVNKGVAETNADRRKQAVTAVGTMGTLPKAVEILEKVMTSDAEPDVRSAAAAMLGDMKSTASIPKLKTAMDKDPEVAFAAAKALWNMGDHSGRDLLQDIVMGDYKSNVSAMEGAKRDAKRKMHDPAYLARTGATTAADALLGPFSVGLKLATELRKDAGAANRLLSINLLAESCDAKGVEAMETAVSHDKNDGVRAGAARGLAICGGKSSVAKLQPLLVYDKYAVQLVAAAAIIRIESKK